MFRVVLDMDAIERLSTEPGLRELLVAKADSIADEARTRAPKRTGEGADSIHSETVINDGEMEVQVSWDIEHDYMRFPERGTRYMRPYSFLRSALEARG